MRRQSAADDRPRVSVSILTYNAAPFLEEAVESVLSQEVDFSVELVIGDDYSTDGTRELIEGYVERYPNIIHAHLHDAHGRGIAGRANNMHNLSACRGEYIAILDGDDYWTVTDKLDRQVAFLDAHPAYACCSSDGVNFSQTQRHSTFLSFPGLRGTTVTFDDYYRSGITGVMQASLIFRREWLLPLPGWFDRILTADHYMQVLLLLRGPCFVLDASTFAYRMHDQSFSKLYNGYAEAILHKVDDYEDLRTFIPELRGGRGPRYYQARYLMSAGSHALRQRDWPGLKLALARRHDYGLLSLACTIAKGFGSDVIRRLRARRAARRLSAAGHALV